MFSKLPRKVWSGVLVLSFIAGIINVVGFLSFNHQGISHLTGVTSMLGAAIAAADIPLILHFLAAILAFVMGCALSGFIIKDSTLRIRRSYGIALVFVALLLFLSIPLFEMVSPLAIYLATCACGLQNAMVTTYSGAALRTTHLSGMFTDLGIAIGHMLRGVENDTRRLKLCAVVISGFLGGGVVGAAGYRLISYQILFLPALLALTLAAVSFALAERQANT